MTLTEKYQADGYLLCKGIFSRETLNPLRKSLQKFHNAWVSDNLEFYQEKALSSAYLTGTKYLGSDDRNELFQFITSQRLLGVLERLMPDDHAFMNTQLFFNPVNPDQRNYWHRDIQYSDYSIEQQKAALADVNVLHFRVPLKSENGIELIPGSHKRWDSEEEFEVRKALNGKSCYQNLPSSLIIPLEPGDLLVFSANIIHRGLYGQDRMAFDILFCDATADLLQHVDTDCLPDSQELKRLERAGVFENSLRLKNSGGAITDVTGLS